MTDMQLITLVVTLVAILGAMFSQRKSVEDMRDVLRAEMRERETRFEASLAGMERRLQTTLDKSFRVLTGRIKRLDAHISEHLADHESRIADLEHPRKEGGQ